jgi:uncharacterized protein YecE (DUF72 family)
MPKTITHEGQLLDVEEPCDDFWAKSPDWVASSDQVLIQLPPSLKFDPDAAEALFRTLRDSFGAMLCVSPGTQRGLRPTSTPC